MFSPFHVLLFGPSSKPGVFGVLEGSVLRLYPQHPPYEAGSPKCKESSVSQSGIA